MPYCRICSTCGVCGTKSRVIVTLESQFRGYDRLLRRCVMYTGKKLSMTNVYYGVMEFFDVSFCDHGYVCAHVCARASSFLRVCGLDCGVHQSASYWTLLAGGDTAGPRRSNDRIPIPTEGRTQEKVKNTTYTFCPEVIAFKYLPGSLARARLCLRSSTAPFK